jgi:hypothetical protein
MQTKGKEAQEAQEAQAVSFVPLVLLVLLVLLVVPPLRGLGSKGQVFVKQVVDLISAVRLNDPANGSQWVVRAQ